MIKPVDDIAWYEGRGFQEQVVTLLLVPLSGSNVLPCQLLRGQQTVPQVQEILGWCFGNIITGILYRSTCPLEAGI